MPATKRYKNWSAVTFATTPIDGVKSVNYDAGIQDLRESGDTDNGISLAAVVAMDPSFTVSTMNAMVLQAALGGTKGIFSATLNDFYNGTLTAGGAWVFTTNAYSYIGSKSLEGAHNQVAMQNLSIKTMWPDGVTNPVGVSAV